MRRLALLLMVFGVCIFSAAQAFGDGNDQYTVLLLHCNGSDGATYFPDDSQSNHSVTANANAQVDTEYKKFGTGSALFDGDSDYLRIPDSEDWYFASGDFTIDFWARFNTIPSASPCVFFAQGTGGNENRYYSAYYTGWGEIGFTVFTDQVQVIAISNPWAPSADIWYHIAIVRNGDNWYIFIDGNQIGVTQVDNDPVGNYVGDFCVGASTIGAGSVDGWIDELRISKGIARWTANFIPPAEEYSASPNEPPVADAGNDVVAGVGEEVTLDASNSYDPDGQIVAWEWRCLSDPAEPIVAQGQLATMNAHGYATELIELTVIDNGGASATDTMQIINPVVEQANAMQSQIANLESENQQQGSQIAALEQTNQGQQAQITGLQQENQQQQGQLANLQQQVEDLEDLIDVISGFPPIAQWLSRNF